MPLVLIKGKRKSGNAIGIVRFLIKLNDSIIEQLLYYKIALHILIRIRFSFTETYLFTLMIPLHVFTFFEMNPLRVVRVLELRKLIFRVICKMLFVVIIHILTFSVPSVKVESFFPLIF